MGGSFSPHTQAISGTPVSEFACVALINQLPAHSLALPAALLFFTWTHEFDDIQLQVIAQLHEPCETRWTSNAPSHLSLPPPTHPALVHRPTSLISISLEAIPGLLPLLLRSCLAISRPSKWQLHVPQASPPPPHALAPPLAAPS